MVEDHNQDVMTRNCDVSEGLERLHQRSSYSVKEIKREFDKASVTMVCSRTCVVLHFLQCEVV